ncbi:MAG: hypothetical protein R6W90_15755 [Ignavibacteriaceae bacterium]
MVLFLIGIIVFLINIPFGYWRGNVKKFSLQWFLAVHIPVPAIVFLRIYSGLGFQFITYPVIVGAYFLGQFTGSKLNRLQKKRNTPGEG